MKQTEINVLISITNDATTLARRINVLAWEFYRMMTEDGHTRTPDQTHSLNTIADALRRSGEEMTSAIDISDRILRAAKPIPAQVRQEVE